MITTFNMNDEARAKLTDRGRLVLQKFDADTALKIRMPYSTPTEGGEIVTELWQLFEIFGPHFYMSADPVFVNNEISIVKR